MFKEIVSELSERLKNINIDLIDIIIVEEGKRAVLRIVSKDFINMRQLTRKRLIHRDVLSVTQRVFEYLLLTPFEYKMSCKTIYKVNHLIH